ncbi:MAG: HesA/MoeB/ThiF family protein [Pseudomonadota bacterium]
MIDNNLQNRYSRNIALDDIGIVGQQKLFAAKILIIGVGGLGCPVGLYLAAAGIGNIGLVDNDKVELCNLQRQILFKEDDVGRKKVNAAYDSIYDLNSQIKVEIFDNLADKDLLRNIIDNYDIIVDCSDNYITRCYINQICGQYHKPLISAAVEKFYGQIYKFMPYLGDDYPCYECLYPASPEIMATNNINCSEAGILGSVAGIIAALQATEIIKHVTNIAGLSGKDFLLMDVKNYSLKIINLAKDPKCKAIAHCDR